jgi:3'-phosphoadenosine 5'-phosphosulfate sulfotransferase (PAPS reductase)/FAD synthetase
MKILSLGWGVQSFTLAAMVALGELGPIDAAIHADTTHESKLTYEFAARWTGWLEERGVMVVMVKNPQPLPDITSQKSDIPAFTRSESSDGQLRRQCTGRWKIAPIRRWEST